MNAHVGLAGYRGVWFFMRRERLAVSAPEGWRSHINQYVANLTSYDKAAEETALRELFGEDFDRRIGPAYEELTTWRENFARSGCFRTRPRAKPRSGNCGRKASFVMTICRAKPKQANA